MSGTRRGPLGAGRGPPAGIASPLVRSAFARISRGPAALRTAALLLLGLCGLALGHSDPFGDIHPNVTNLDGNFSIIFTTSLPGKAPDYTQTQEPFRTVYSPLGALVAPRHLMDPKQFQEESGPVGLHGKVIRVGDSGLSFGGNGTGEHPGYLLKSPDGKITPVRLPWPDDVKLDLLEDVAVAPEGIAISGKENRTELKLYWFPFASTGAPTILNLGETCCIYEFPVASNLAYAGGRFWLAFMRADGDDVKLFLWSWKPGEVQGREERLDSPGFWNSHLSLAAIGDRLCLAYHCQDSNGNDPARIVTVFREAK